MTTTASSPAIMVPDSTPRASGTMANIVVSAVIRMGRSLVCPPWTRASWVLRPSLRSCSTTAISTIALVRTMPTSISMPIMPDTPSV